jgi:hypothetical protein
MLSPPVSVSTFTVNSLKWVFSILHVIKFDSFSGSANSFCSMLPARGLSTTALDLLVGFDDKIQSKQLKHSNLPKPLG